MTVVFLRTDQARRSSRSPGAPSLLVLFAGALLLRPLLVAASAKHVARHHHSQTATAGVSARAATVTRSRRRVRHASRLRGVLSAADTAVARRAGRATARAAQVEGDAPIPPLSVPDRNTPIMVTMASFLDGVRCARTINWALEKASLPERLSFTVLQAKTDSDPDCLDEFRNTFLEKLCAPADGRLKHLADCKQVLQARLKIWTVDPKQGKGPAHQRGLENELAELNDRDDKFCLDIDAHMDFRPGWDEIMVQDWLSTGNEFAVLTAYPLDMKDAKKGGEFDNTRIDLCGFEMENGIPRGKGAGTVFTPSPDKRGPEDAPYLTMNWAAGQSFQRCHADRNVPVDPNLKWIFTGEEVDRAVRFWTHGYDLYMPSTTAILHDYGHAVQTFFSFTEPGKQKQEEESRTRLFTLLDIGTPVEGMDGVKLLGEYGVGSQRSLEDYVTWSKEDWGGPWSELLQKQGGAVNPEHDFCKKLKRRPVRDREALLASAQNRKSPHLAQTEAKEAGAHMEK